MLRPLLASKRSYAKRKFIRQAQTEFILTESGHTSFGHYLATFETWRVQGDDLSLVLSLDEAVVLPEAWRWPWWSLAEGLPFEFPRPSVGPGRFVLRSMISGRCWRIER